MEPQQITKEDYEFDVFISYSRLKEWQKWVERHFVPIFEHWLTAELGREARVFVDYDMESGISWPTKLGQKLARSAVLVPLWTKNYFNSEWCTTEFSQMLAREKKYKFRTRERPEGLIVPIIIHDGEHFPKDIGHINHLNLCECANVRMVHDGIKAELLSERLCAWMVSVEKAIHNAPPYDPVWDGIVAEMFMSKYRKSTPKQRNVPR